jgi:hypothetical protein
MKEHQKSESFKLIQNHWIDTNEIVGKEITSAGIKVIFANGDEISFTWRDEAEKQCLLTQLTC